LPRARLDPATSAPPAAPRGAPSPEVLRRLAAHLVSIREEEQARIAREIHDQIGQPLTALQLDLAWIRRRLSRGPAPAASQEVRARLLAMSRLVDDTMGTMRRIVTDLRPAVLDHLGLADAIAWQARDFESRTGIRCEVRSTVRDQRFDPAASTAVLRILQEALTNAARHSVATRVDVRLSARSGVLRLEVEDNGSGIAAAAVTSHRSMGLIGMQERALQHRGELEVSGRAGRGTTVRLRLPVGAGAREARGGKGAP